MKIHRFSDFTGGWFIGDFLPTAHRTQEVEVAYKRHSKGEPWAAHRHEIATEINYLVSGKMKLRGVTLEAGTVFVIEPGEVADPEFLRDCEIVVVKLPSVVGDKYEV